MQNTHRVCHKSRQSEICGKAPTLPVLGLCYVAPEMEFGYVSVASIAVHSLDYDSYLVVTQEMFRIFRLFGKIAEKDVPDDCDDDRDDSLPSTSVSMLRGEWYIKQDHI